MGVELALVGVAGGPGEQGLTDDGVGLGVDDGDVGGAGVGDRELDLDVNALAWRVLLHVGHVVGEL